MNKELKNPAIAMFVYNRPLHTKWVLEGLQKNDIQHLYIFSDGAKEGEEKKVKEVRQLISQIKWCETTVVEREKNYGLARSIISGVDHVLDHHNSIIVLEDDCIPLKNFVHFMESCLSKYEDNSQVMNISGYSPSISLENYQYDIYFTHRISSWGWGTWRDAWSKFRRDENFLNRITQSEVLRSKTKNAGYDLIPMARFDDEGKADSWAVYWALTVAIHDGVCINPVRSLVRNIGHDSSGTHTRKRFWRKINSQLETGKSQLKNINFPPNTKVRQEIDNEFSQRMGGGRLAPLKFKIKRMLGLY